MIADLAEPFYFVRHGETHWNAKKRPQGQLETALNAVGRAQARSLAAFFVERQAALKIQRVVSSPMVRVRDTAEPIAHRLGLTVDYDEGLREVGLGAGQGAPHGPWLKAYWSGRETPEGAEPFEAFSDRAAAAIARVVDRPGVLIVAHGGIWRGLLAHVRVEPRFWMTNAAPVRVSPDWRGPWRVEPLVDDAASDGAAV